MPLENCGEVLPIGDLESHLEVHAIEYYGQQPDESVAAAGALSESDWTMTEDSEPSNLGGQASRVKTYYNPIASIASQGQSAPSSDTPEGYQIRQGKKLGVGVDPDPFLSRMNTSKE